MDPDRVSVAPLAGDELPAAAALLARAYRDNPLTVALIGDDPHARLAITEAIFLARLEAMPPPLGARAGGVLGGAAGFSPPGAPGPDADLFLAALSRGGEPLIGRTGDMLAAVRRHSPAGPLWHLGPVGVDPAFQHRGIGRLLVARFCENMDAQGASATLDTDQPRNVRLYERHGFKTVHTAKVIAPCGSWPATPAPGTLPVPDHPPILTLYSLLPSFPKRLHQILEEPLLLLRLPLASPVVVARLAILVPEIAIVPVAPVVIVITRLAVDQLVEFTPLQPDSPAGRANIDLDT
jgi:ribosomal protein S18 acetylase RimI-like enzyme